MKLKEAVFAKAVDEACVVAAFTTVGLAIGYSVGCNAGAAEAARRQIDIISYGAELHACVEDATDRLGADQCTAAARQKWCGPGGRLSDAGACSTTDGGSE